MYVTVTQYRLVKSREMCRDCGMVLWPFREHPYWQLSMTAVPFVLSKEEWMVIH